MGAYADTNGAIAGFVTTGTRFQTVADPLASDTSGNGTTVTAASDLLTLAGFYRRSDGIAHGFIAYPG